MADVITFEFQFRGDPLKFTNAIERKKNRVLFRIGGWTQQALRKQIRPASGRKPNPGKPPRAHVGGNAGLRDVRFQVDQLNDLVRVGPRIYGQPSRSRKNRRGQVRQVISKNVVRLLEEGGTVKVIISYPKSGHVYVRTVTYRQFPWIRPTLQRASRKFRQFIVEEGLRTR